MNLLTRDEWGAAPPTKAPLRQDLPARGWAVHHNGPLVHCADIYAEIAFVRGVQRYHQGTKKWSDIAYSFAVGQSGLVFECRGWGWNQFANGSDNVAPFTEHGDAEWFTVLCLIGWDPETGYQQEPSAEMVAALDELRALSIRLDLAGLETRPHRAWQTKACPGDTLTAWCEHHDNRPLDPPAPPTPTLPGDPDMATLITVTDDPAGAVLVYDGITLRWVRRADDPTIAMLPNRKALTVDEVRTVIASGAITEGPSPSIAGSAVGW